MQVYDLAFSLGLTVSQISEMEYDEFAGWFEYLRRKPPGWRDDLRFGYLLNAQGVKKKPQEIFPSLKAAMDTDRGLSAAAGKSVDQDGFIATGNFQASGLFAKISETGFSPEFKE